MRETAIASCEFVSLSRQPRSKKIKFTSISGNLRKVPSNPSVRGLSREVTARRPAGCAEAVSLGTSRHETASFAPIGSLRSEEASRDTLAKIISTNVSVQFLRRLGNRRVGVARGARVHRSARVRVESGLAGRAGTSLGYSSVSKASLRKTGVLLNSAGDFREFSAEKVQTPVSGDFGR